MNITQIHNQFPDREACLKYLEDIRWRGKPRCPYCNTNRITQLPKEHRYHCNVCNTSFSVTVRTIFHKTKIDLQRWFLAIDLVLNARKDISARQLSQIIDVNKNTGQLILSRIRKALREQNTLLTDFFSKIDK